MGPALGLALFVLTVWILRHEFRAYHLDDVLGHLRSIPARSLLTALALTVVGYVILTGYDTLAFRYIGNPLSYPRIALASFVAYVFTHNIGLSFFGGSAVRFRMLSPWGVKANEIAKVIAFGLLTFWMGFFLLAGIVHAFWPLPLPLAWPDLPFATSRPIGWALLIVTAAYVALTVLRREPVSLFRLRLEIPGPGMTAAQFALSAVDWLVAAAVLYVVFPNAPGLTFPVFVGAYLMGARSSASPATCL